MQGSGSGRAGEEVGGRGGERRDATGALCCCDDREIDVRSSEARVEW